MKHLFTPEPLTARASLGLLCLRLLAGVALMFHGWRKIQRPFDWMGADSATPGILQALAALAEFGGGLALALGLLTPLAALGILCTMGYAAFLHISRGDPFVGRPRSWEPASLFFVITLCVLLAGPGRYSLDARLFGRRR